MNEKTSINSIYFNSQSMTRFDRHAAVCLPD